MAKVYAVFEGGGVKGTALVGALAKAQQEKIEFKGYAGSSAGHDHIPLSQLKDHGEFFKQLFSAQAVKDAKSDLHPLLSNRWCGTLRTFLSLRKRHGAHTARFRLLGKSLEWLWEHKGFYGTAGFLQWLQQHLNAKGPCDANGHVTFGSLFAKTKTALKVVAADVGNCAPFVFSHATTADLEVAQAVQASMSIPFFFQPFPFGSKFLVDGGVISNFPAWVFDAEKDGERERGEADTPVLGFRLVPEHGPSQVITSFDQYATAIYRTLAGGTNRLQTRNVSNLCVITVNTPADIAATKFDLALAERDRLYEKGFDAAQAFFGNAENTKMLCL